AENLYISETQKIDVNQITDIEFDTTDNVNVLKITLDNNYRKYDLTSTNNVSLNQNIISISNFTFYTAYQTTDAKLNNLKNNIQDYINLSSNQFSLEEFTSQLNSVDFKNQVATYLSIPANAIDTISYNNNTLIITPIPMVKFTSDTVSSSTNIINQISVSDLKFYSFTDLIGLENLYNVLNNYIIDTSRKFTAKQFADQVNDNNATIKSLVTSNLYVDENNKIDPSLVTSVTFNETSKQLEVTLNSDYKKFNLTSTNNVSLNGNIITISGFTFYDGIEITQNDLDGFQNNLQGYINEVSRQYTQEQFTSQLNLDGFKNLVSTSLSIPTSSINSISFENGILTISPNSMK
ncbi:MAG: hypothetical protein K2L64_03760, partial [Ureaplasma sp.]|nr:hypothetical protein [Ureaplasma sp.]